MKKTAFAVLSLVLAFCFSVSVFAVTFFRVDVEGINQSPDNSSTIIYTRDFAEKVPVSTGDYFVITVTPRNQSTVPDVSEVASEDVSEVVSEDISAVVSEDVSEVVSQVVSDGETVSEVTSDIIPEIVSQNDNIESATFSDYKYKVEKVYLPTDDKSDIEIPENAFALLFHLGKDSSTPTVSDVTSPETRGTDVSEIETGDLVAVHGVDFEALTVTDGAYVEIDTSNKGLMGDIPQTSDNNMTAVFTVFACLSVISAAWFYRKRLAV